MTELLLRNFPKTPTLSCNSNSLQPFAVHSHWLLCVQPNYSWKRNTAKSCTEYSQNICSVQLRKMYMAPLKKEETPFVN